MAWCHQTTSHYPSRCWPSSRVQYGTTRSHWVTCILVHLVNWIPWNISHESYKICCWIPFWRYINIINKSDFSVVRNLFQVIFSWSIAIVSGCIVKTNAVCGLPYIFTTSNLLKWIWLGRCSRYRIIIIYCYHLLPLLTHWDLHKIDIFQTPFFNAFFWKMQLMVWSWTTQDKWVAVFYKKGLKLHKQSPH